MFYPKTDYVDLEMIYTNRDHSLPSFRNKTQNLNSTRQYTYSQAFSQTDQFAQKSWFCKKSNWISRIHYAVLRLHLNPLSIPMLPCAHTAQTYVPSLRWYHSFYLQTCYDYLLTHWEECSKVIVLKYLLIQWQFSKKKIIPNMVVLLK